MAVDVAQLLSFTVKNNASDLHLSGGVPPMIRVDGDIKRVNMPALTHKDVNSMVYDIMNDKQRKDYEEFLETDFSFEIPKLARFRVNAFNQNRGAGAVFRTIPTTILSLEDLGCPEVFRDIVDVPRGLVLVTGPTGSGKTVSLYTGLNILNTEDRNISTAEDPAWKAAPAPASPLFLATVWPALSWRMTFTRGSSAYVARIAGVSSSDPSSTTTARWSAC